MAHHLTVVGDGIEAITFLTKKGSYANAPVPDVVLMDIHLPRMGGFEILAEIQADSQLNQIPIVVLTSLPSLITGTFTTTFSNPMTLTSTSTASDRS